MPIHRHLTVDEKIWTLNKNNDDDDDDDDGDVFGGGDAFIN